MAVGSFVGMIVGNSRGVSVEIGSGLGETIFSVGTGVLVSSPLMPEQDVTTQLMTVIAKQNFNRIIRSYPWSYWVKGLV